MLKNIRLCLVGFGNVGKALAKLLLKKEAELADRYNLAFKVIGIITGSHGEALDPEGLDLARALHLMEAGMSLNNLGTKNAPKDTNAFITHCPADFMVETTPVNHLT
ncbi:MAG: homoserine dehydrogenase, partial [Anaerolineales bacterium]